MSIFIFVVFFCYIPSLVHFDHQNIVLFFNKIVWSWGIHLKTKKQKKSVCHFSQMQFAILAKDINKNIPSGQMA